MSDLSSLYAPCHLCPRNCGVDRTQRLGVCQSPAHARIARAAVHRGEEPCLVGTGGSGTVFFTGCTLRCVFCQNRVISQPLQPGAFAGIEVTVPKLQEIFLRLRDTGVHNLNLVTGTQFIPSIAEALAGLQLGIPVVWNSSGYESCESLQQLQGLVDIYMPDFKYADADLARRYSAAPDYPTVVLDAIREMYRQTGPFMLSPDGLLLRGVLVRHLILPGQIENTLRVIDQLEDALPWQGMLFSLMSQYTPVPGTPDMDQLRRALTTAEVDRCLSYLDFSPIEHGFFQDLDSVGVNSIPCFDGTGVIDS